VGIFLISVAADFKFTHFQSTWEVENIRDDRKGTDEFATDDSLVV
jgi:hypothetical protein